MPLLVAFRLFGTLFALVFCLLASPALAQSWEELPIEQSLRFNDIYFISPDTGWAVNGSAYIYRTVDGGQSWQLKFYRDDTHLRSVGFLNASRGFAGNVGEGEFGTTNPVPLYESSNGGSTWSAVTEFDGPTPAGLCGMHVVNDSTVVAVGRVRGPAYFIRTTDGGETWQSKDMSEYAAGLIDVYFPHPDTGFAVGLTNSVHSSSSGIVIATVDGGETWETRFVSTRTGEWFWKMSWPSRRTGFASIQRNGGGPIYIAKTSDGGLTWEEKYFRSNYFVQGIGFIDENTGWVGGNTQEPAYMTTDGGTTWTAADIGPRLNRFRFLSDTLGYAAGAAVYKFVRPAATSAPRPELHTLSVDPIYPNPFTEEAHIGYRLDGPSPVSIRVYDALGRTVRGYELGMQPPGYHGLTWDGNDHVGRTVAPGSYFIVLRVGDVVHTRPVVFLR